MAIQVVVDGYNLIGSDKGLRGNLEQKRNQLVQELRNYQELKGFPVTVVFDGWRSGWVHEVEDTSSGITVVYSKQGEKADSVIVRVAREIGNGCVVVTSDREVQRAVERFGSVAVNAGEFRRILRNAEYGFDDDDTEDYDARAGKRGNPKKLSKIERRRRERLKKLRL